jgi:predicted ATPase
VGSDSVEQDKTLAQVRQLAKNLKLSWTKQTHRGFFLRAEDFFGYAKRQAQIREELEDDLRNVDDTYQGRSALARELARMPYQTEIGDMQRRYGQGLDSHSHGESFFTFFQSRFVPNGLYLLDEPDAPLSPMRQLSLLTLLKMMVDQNAQFVIATHSPLIMAYPGATILSFDEGKITPVDWADLEHVSITRMFLNNPEQFLKELLD